MKNLKAVLYLLVITVVSLIMTLNVSADETVKIRVIDESTQVDFSYQVKAGQTLNEIKEQSYASKLKSVIDDPDDKYFTFINVATGKAVDFNEKIFSDLTIKAISKTDKVTIKIANTGNTFKNLDAGITINTLKDLSYGSQVKNLIEAKNKEFAKFIDVATGEEIGLDEPIYVDLTIKAVYYITVNIDKVDHKVLDTSKLEDLYQYAAKKEGYEFTGFVDVEGNPATDADVVDKAILTSTYKQIEAEEVPDTYDSLLVYVSLSAISLFAMAYICNQIKKFS